MADASPSCEVQNVKVANLQGLSENLISRYSSAATQLAKAYQSFKEKGTVANKRRLCKQINQLASAIDIAWPVRSMAPIRIKPSNGRPFYLVPVKYEYFKDNYHLQPLQTFYRIERYEGPFRRNGKNVVKVKWVDWDTETLELYDEVRDFLPVDVTERISKINVRDTRTGDVWTTATLEFGKSVEEDYKFVRFTIDKALVPELLFESSGLVVELQKTKNPKLWKNSIYAKQTKTGAARSVKHPEAIDDLYKKAVNVIGDFMPELTLAYFSRRADIYITDAEGNRKKVANPGSKVLCYMLTREDVANYLQIKPEDKIGLEAVPSLFNYENANTMEDERLKARQILVEKVYQPLGFLHDNVFLSANKVLGLEVSPASYFKHVPMISTVSNVRKNCDNNYNVTIEFLKLPKPKLDDSTTISFTPSEIEKKMPIAENKISKQRKRKRSNLQNVSLDSKKSQSAVDARRPKSRTTVSSVPLVGQQTISSRVSNSEQNSTEKQDKKSDQNSTIFPDALNFLRAGTTRILPSNTFIEAADK